MPGLWDIFSSILGLNQSDQKSNISGIQQLDTPAGLMGGDFNKGSRAEIPIEKRYNPAGPVGSFLGAGSSPEMATKILSMMSPIAASGISAGAASAPLAGGIPSGFSPSDWNDIGKLELNATAGNVGIPYEGTGYSRAGFDRFQDLQRSVGHLRNVEAYAPTGTAKGIPMEGGQGKITQALDRMLRLNQQLSQTDNPLLRSSWENVFSGLPEKFYRARGWE